MKPTVARFTRLCILLLLFSRGITSAAQPANDNCANAVTLTPGLACTSTAGTLRNAGGGATATAGINAFCGNAASPTYGIPLLRQTLHIQLRLVVKGLILPTLNYNFIAAVVDHYLRLFVELHH